MWNNDDLCNDTGSEEGSALDPLPSQGRRLGASACKESSEEDRAIVGDEVKQPGGDLQEEAGDLWASRNSETVERGASTASMSQSVSMKNKRSRLSNLNGVDPLTKQLVSFEGQSALLRGSRLCSIMRHGAGIFSSSRGSAATYDLSEQVSAIYAFISHNWSVPRPAKFFCLAMYFNFHQALLIAGVLNAAIGAATLGGLLPLIALDGGMSESGVCGTVLVAPVFLLAVCFGHEWRRLVGYSNPTVFLDKTCIHQTDRALQEAGIKKLGAFVKCSSHIVIIYTDVYLRKLWTVYEVACFLSLHPTNRLEVVPPYMPLLSLGGVVAVYVPRLLLMFFQIIIDKGYRHALDGPEAVSIVLMSLALSLLLRHMSRTLAAACRCMDGFKVEECKCTNEEDRPLVYRNIALLMRATGEVEIDSTDEQARLTFNQMVSKKLAGPLVLSASLQYQHVCGIFLCGLFPAYLDVYMGKFPLPAELWTRARICYMLDLCGWLLGFFPLLSVVLSWWTGRLLHLSGWWDRSFTVCGGFVVAAGAIAMRLSQMFLVHAAVHEGSDNGLAGLVFTLAVSALLAVNSFALQRRLQKGYDGDEAGEESLDGEEGLRGISQDLSRDGTSGEIAAEELIDTGPVLVIDRNVGNSADLVGDGNTGDIASEDGIVTGPVVRLRV